MPSMRPEPPCEEPSGLCLPSLLGMLMPTHRWAPLPLGINLMVSLSCLEPSMAPHHLLGKSKSLRMAWTNGTLSVNSPLSVRTLRRYTPR